MDQEKINASVNECISDNLTPKQDERDYITAKYSELQEIIGHQCLRSGSYARFTANTPVHDLDIIYPTSDSSLTENPSSLIQELCAQLESGYKKLGVDYIKSITPQTHSATVEFSDNHDGFSIDIVPAIELPETNEFGDPLYLVPEIGQLNRRNRELRYQEAAENPINWVKSDPRGYRKVAQDLNDQNPDFHHSAKLVKASRHAWKEVYGDEFKLKSFHLEQIVTIYMTNNPDACTIDAAIECFGLIAQYLDKPQIPDRADQNRFIDEYVANLSVEEKRPILQYASTSLQIANQLLSADNQVEVKRTLESLLNPKQKQASFSSASTTTVSQARQPWKD
jgi:hypothetical protein